MVPKRSGAFDARLQEELKNVKQELFGLLAITQTVNMNAIVVRFAD